MYMCRPPKEGFLVCRFWFFPLQAAADLAGHARSCVPGMGHQVSPLPGLGTGLICVASGSWSGVLGGWGVLPGSRPPGPGYKPNPRRVSVGTAQPCLRVCRVCVCVRVRVCVCERVQVEDLERSVPPLGNPSHSPRILLLPSQPSSCPFLPPAPRFEISETKLVL